MSRPATFPRMYSFCLPCNLSALVCLNSSRDCRHPGHPVCLLPSVCPLFIIRQPVEARRCTLLPAAATFCGSCTVQQVRSLRFRGGWIWQCLLRLARPFLYNSLVWKNRSTTLFCYFHPSWRARNLRALVSAGNKKLRF